MSHNNSEVMINDLLAEDTTEVTPPGNSQVSTNHFVNINDNRGMLTPMEEVTRNLRRGLGRAIAMIHITSQNWLDLEDILSVNAYGKQAFLAVGHFADQLLRLICDGQYPLLEAQPTMAGMTEAIFSCADFSPIFTRPQLAALASWVSDDTWETYYGTPTGMADYLFGPRPERYYANQAFQNAAKYRSALMAFDIQTFSNLSLYHTDGCRAGRQAHKTLFEKSNRVQPAKEHTLSGYMFPDKRERRRKESNDEERAATPKRPRSPAATIPTPPVSEHGDPVTVASSAAPGDHSPKSKRHHSSGPPGDRRREDAKTPTQEDGTPTGRPTSSASSKSSHSKKKSKSSHRRSYSRSKDAHQKQQAEPSKTSE